MLIIKSYLCGQTLYDRRNKLYNYLKKNNIICRKFWFPLSKRNFYSNQKHSSFKNTKKIENKIMWLPSSF